MTPNDTGDGDASNANNLQNHPVLTSATFIGGNVTIAGTLDSTPSSTFTIEFFQSTACDETGFGEGEMYIGQTTVHTDAGGNGVIDSLFAVPSTSGVITATATNTSTQETSEFSACESIVDL